MTEEKKTENSELLLKEEDKLPPKASWYWIKNSRGEASASLTFVSVAFTITTLAFIASMFESIGPITIRAFDVGAASVYFIPLLSLYFGRRFTEGRYPEKTNGLK